MTRQQREALYRLYQRDTSRAPSYRAFRRLARRAYGDCYMIHWCGMWLGIEEDGYTHS